MDKWTFFNCQDLTPCLLRALQSFLPVRQSSFHFVAQCFRYCCFVSVFQFFFPFGFMPVPSIIAGKECVCVCVFAFTISFANAGCLFWLMGEVNSLSTGNMWVGDQHPEPGPPLCLQGRLLVLQWWTGAQTTRWLRDPRMGYASWYLNLLACK